MNKTKSPAKEPLVHSASKLSWHELQEVLRGCSTEDEVSKLMETEKAGHNRLRWLIRMQGRLRSLRTDRENSELMESQKKTKSKTKKR